MQFNSQIKMSVLKLMKWAVIIYSLVVVFFYFASILPVKRQLVYLNQRTETLKQEVGKLKGEYVKKWESQKWEIAEIIDSFQQKKDDKDIILSEIFNISQDSGIETERTEPLKDEALGDTMLKYSWRVNCRANYSAIGTFFNKIDRSPLFLCVELPSIQSAEDLTQTLKQLDKVVDEEQLKHKAEFLISSYRFKVK
jgi:hypothetical protein